MGYQFQTIRVQRVGLPFSTKAAKADKIPIKQASIRAYRGSLPPGKPQQDDILRNVKPLAVQQTSKIKNGDRANPIHPRLGMPRF